MKDNESWHSVKVIGIVAIVAIVAIVGFIIGRGSVGSGSSSGSTSDSSSGDIAGKAYGSTGNYFVVSGTSDNSYDAAAVMLRNNKDMTKWYWSIGGDMTPDVLDDLLLKYGKGDTYAGPYLTVKKDTGNIGIGITNPTTKLEVGGGVSARQVIAINPQDIFHSRSEIGSGYIWLSADRDRDKVFKNTSLSYAEVVTSKLRLHSTNISRTDCREDEVQGPGTVQYNTTTGHFYGCTPTGWKQLDNP